jgi:hypothetical protein
MVSKLNNDRRAGEGASQAIGRIYGKIGFGGLWNGLPVRIFMIGTLTAFQWLIYDSFKVYLGVSPFQIFISQAVLLTSCSYLPQAVTDGFVLVSKIVIIIRTALGSITWDNQCLLPTCMIAQIQVLVVRSCRISHHFRNKRLRQRHPNPSLLLYLLR